MDQQKIPPLAVRIQIKKDICDLPSVPIGKPLTNRTAYVLNKHLQPQPVGAAGTLFVGAAGLGRGYLNKPELTFKNFIKNPFCNNKNSLLYNTQDRVRWLRDGNLDYLGRIDSQVKIRGYRIELKDIESQILLHPEVKQAFATVHSINSEKYLTLYYISITPLESLALRSFLSNLLPTYMLPHVFIHLESLPLIANGKIDKNALPIPVIKTESYHNNEKQFTTIQTLHKIWAKVLLLENLDLNTSFFDLGGDSLKLISVKQAIEQDLSISLSIIDLFQHTTLQQLADHIKNYTQSEKFIEKRPVNSKSVIEDIFEPIAIIGMSCRLPKGINDPESLWQLLLDKKSTIRSVLYEEIIDNPFKYDKNFVKKTSTLENTYDFDAQFFGYSVREAELIDPQQRHFLECAWQALEHSGNVPEKIKGDVGVFASQGKNRYYDERIALSKFADEKITAYQGMIANEKDFLATRVSFKLNLTGPSMTIQTGCSSSLVAVNIACDSLRANNCYMALAGGVSLLDEHGYIYQEGMIESADGYCRPFDYKANGTVAGSGVGVVVLKRLSDAIADKDMIYAVIKGWSVNNDGANKIGYTAPSISGQSKVIENAITKANIKPDKIDYVEAHGTATALGDPIEVKALHQVYSPYYKDNKSYCIIGSVKSNIGHTDAAAGVFGLIKATLMVKNKVIPPTLHFNEFNPEIARFNSIFQVTNAIKEWDNPVRTAAISSFGVGGTNAHTIIQSYNNSDSMLTEINPVLIPVSAKTEESFNILMKEIINYVQSSSVQDLESIAFTSQQGRSEFQIRGYIIVDDIKGVCKIYKNFARASTDNKKFCYAYIINAESDCIVLEMLYKAKVAIDTLVVSNDCLNLDSVKKHLNSKIVEDVSQLDNNVLWATIGSSDCNKTRLHYDISSYNDPINQNLMWLDLIGWLWTHGAIISWENINYFSVGTCKTSIPTYPFIHNTYALPKVTKLSLQKNTSDLLPSENLSKENSIMMQLKDIWSNVLGVKSENINHESDFFDLGGDSIAFVDTFTHIQKSFSLNIVLADIINCTSLGTMLNFIISKQI